jgi:hypothetical protein
MMVIQYPISVERDQKFLLKVPLPILVGIYLPIQHLLKFYQASQKLGINFELVRDCLFSLCPKIVVAGLFFYSARLRFFSAHQEPIKIF